MKQAKEELDAYIRSAKHEHLSLTVHKFRDECAKEKFECLSEDVVQAAGTEWKLLAMKYKDKHLTDRFFVALEAISTLECDVRFGLEYSFRLSNAADPSKVIRKAGIFFDQKLITGDSKSLLFPEIELKDLVDPKGGFLREGGSIHMELDFTILSAKVEGLPDDDAGQDEASRRAKQALLAMIRKE